MITLDLSDADAQLVLDVLKRGVEQMEALQQKKILRLMAQIKVGLETNRYRRK